VAHIRVVAPGGALGTVVSRPTVPFVTLRNQNILPTAAQSEVVEGAVENGVGRKRVAFRAQAEAVER
jgi:hypothetical protein